jgi:hypothetical protein
MKILAVKNLKNLKIPHCQNSSKAKSIPLEKTKNTTLSEQFKGKIYTPKKTNNTTLSEQFQGKIYTPKKN